MDDEIISVVVVVLSSIVAIVGSFGSLKFAKKQGAKDETEISKDKADVLNVVGKETNIFKMMAYNLIELKEFYTLSKQQARWSFYMALIMSFLGFVLFAIEIVASHFGGKDVNFYSALAGAIVEVIAGLFFFVYNRSMKRINIFFGSLLDTQRYLSSVQLVDKIQNNKDLVYAYIISAFMGKNDININDIVQKKD